MIQHRVEAYALSKQDKGTYVTSPSGLMWGDDAPSTWWAAALTCRTESKPAIKNVRLYYTCIVLAALEKQQHIQITPPQEEEEEAEEE